MIHAMLALSMLAALCWVETVDSSSPLQGAPARTEEEKAPGPRWCASGTDEARPRDLHQKHPAPGWSIQPTLERFAVTLHHAHTRELLPLTAGPSTTRKGKNDPAIRLPSAERLARFMRCRVTGDRHEMDPRLLPVAVAAARHFDAPRIVVISAFRSPKFNEMLRKKGHEVASTSRHMKGLALDFLLPDVRARALARHLNRDHQGGLGTYPHSDFVHVDFGRRRRWKGK